MKGVSINTNNFQKRSKWGLISILTFIALILFILLISPFILLFVIIQLITDLFSKKKEEPKLNTWINIKTNSELKLSTKFLNLDETPKIINEYLDSKPSRIFSSSPNLTDLNGYFSDLKIERDDGVFLQRILIDEAENKILSANLLFLDYKTMMTEVITDLNGFEISTKGKPNDFTLHAFNDNKEYEIEIVQE